MYKKSKWTTSLGPWACRVIANGLGIQSLARDIINVCTLVWIHIHPFSSDARRIFLVSNFLLFLSHDLLRFCSDLLSLPLVSEFQRYMGCIRCFWFSIFQPHPLMPVPGLLPLAWPFISVPQMAGPTYPHMVLCLWILRIHFNKLVCVTCNLKTVALVDLRRCFGPHVCVRLQTWTSTEKWATNGFRIGYILQRWKTELKARKNSRFMWFVGMPTGFGPHSTK